MGNQDYSIKQLEKFLDHSIRNGPLKPETAKNRKQSALAVLGTLDRKGLVDLRDVDLAEVSKQFAEINQSTMKPSSLKVYESRLRSAVHDWFFDVSCGFQNLPRRAGDQVDHGHEGLGIAVAPGSCARGLEQPIESFKACVGVGGCPSSDDSFRVRTQGLQSLAYRNRPFQTAIAPTWII